MPKFNYDIYEVVDANDAIDYVDDEDDEDDDSKYIDSNDSNDSIFSFEDKINQLYDLMNGHSDFSQYWKRKLRRLLPVIESGSQSNQIFPLFPTFSKKTPLINATFILEIEPRGNWRRQRNIVLGQVGHNATIVAAKGRSVFTKQTETALNTMLCPIDINISKDDEVVDSFHLQRDMQCAFLNDEKYRAMNLFKNNKVDAIGVIFGNDIEQYSDNFNIFDADAYIQYVKGLRTGSDIHVSIRDQTVKGKVIHVDGDKMHIAIGTSQIVEIFDLKHIERNKYVIDKQYSKQDFIAYASTKPKPFIVKGRQASLKMCDVTGDDMLVYLRHIAKSAPLSQVPPLAPQPLPPAPLNYDIIMEDYPDLFNSVYNNQSWKHIFSKKSASPRRVHAHSDTIKTKYAKLPPFKLSTDLEDFALHEMILEKFGKKKNAKAKANANYEEVASHLPKFPSLPKPHFHTVKDMIVASQKIKTFDPKAKATLLLCLNSYRVTKKLPSGTKKISEYPYDYKIYTLKQVKIDGHIFWDRENEVDEGAYAPLKRGIEESIELTLLKPPFKTNFKQQSKSINFIQKGGYNSEDDDDHEIINEFGNTMDVMLKESNNNDDDANIEEISGNPEIVTFVKRLASFFQGRTVPFTNAQLNVIIRLPSLDINKNKVRSMLMVFTYFIAFYLLSFKLPTRQIKPDPKVVQQTIADFTESSMSIKPIVPYFAGILREIELADKIQLNLTPEKLEAYIDNYFISGIQKVPRLRDALLKKRDVASSDSTGSDSLRTKMFNKYRTPWTGYHEKSLPTRMDPTRLDKAQQLLVAAGIENNENNNDVGPNFLNELRSENKSLQSDDMFRALHSDSDANKSKAVGWGAISDIISQYKNEELRNLFEKEILLKGKDKEKILVLLNFIGFNIKNVLGKYVYKHKFNKISYVNVSEQAIYDTIASLNSMEDESKSNIDKYIYMMKNLLNIRTDMFASDYKNMKYALSYILTKVADTIPNSMIGKIISDPLRLKMNINLTTIDDSRFDFEKAREKRKMDIMDMYSNLSDYERRTLKQIVDYGLTSNNAQLLDHAKEKEDKGGIDGQWENAEDNS